MPIEKKYRKPKVVKLCHFSGGRQNALGTILQFIQSKKTTFFNEKLAFRLPAGRHRLCYVMPRTEWVGRNIQYYPRLGHFLESMGRDAALFGHMPTCGIGKGMESALLKLFGREEIAGKDLESILLRDAKRVIYHY